MSWYRLYMFEWSMMKTCTFILLFISSSHVSNIVCLMNSNVKRRLLENYSSSVTKLDISGLLTLCRLREQLSLRVVVWNSVICIDYSSSVTKLDISGLLTLREQLSLRAVVWNSVICIDHRLTADQISSVLAVDRRSTTKGLIITRSRSPICACHFLKIPSGRSAICL